MIVYNFDLCIQQTSNYSGSANLETCLRLISDFESVNPSKKYISDFKVFAQESNLEDFIGDFGEAIVVSTMHKAKGREFDNVFCYPETNVRGMTRKNVCCMSP